MVATLTGHTGPVNCVKFVPATLVAPGGTGSSSTHCLLLLSGAADSTVRVWAWYGLEHQPSWECVHVLQVSRPCCIGGHMGAGAQCEPARAAAVAALAAPSAGSSCQRCCTAYTYLHTQLGCRPSNLGPFDSSPQHPTKPTAALCPPPLIHPAGPQQPHHIAGPAGHVSRQLPSGCHLGRPACACVGVLPRRHSALGSSPHSRAQPCSSPTSGSSHHHSCCTFRGSCLAA